MLPNEWWECVDVVAKSVSMGAPPPPPVAVPIPPPRPAIVENAEDQRALALDDNDAFIEYVKEAYASRAGVRAAFSPTQKRQMFLRLLAILQRHPRYAALTHDYTPNCIVVSSPNGRSARFDVVTPATPRGVRLSIGDALHPRAWTTCVHGAARAVISPQLEDFKEQLFRRVEGVECPLTQRWLTPSSPDVDVDHYRMCMVDMFREWMRVAGYSYRDIKLRANMKQMADVSQRQSWFRWHATYCRLYPDALKLTDASANRSKGARGADAFKVRAGIRREQQRARGRAVARPAGDGRRAVQIEIV